MLIRTMFLLLSAVLLLLLSGLGLWQINDSYAKVRAVDWLQQSNQLVGLSQQAAVELAVERGLTAYLLELHEQQEDNELLWLKLQQQRQHVDTRMQQLGQQFERLSQQKTTHPLHTFQQSLDQAIVKLSIKRAEVNQSIQHHQSVISSRHWIQEINALVEVLHSIAGISMLPLEDNIYSYAAQPIAKDVLFTLAEYLGRERAIVVTAIAGERPLNAKEQQLLSQNQSVVEQTYARAAAILKQLPEYNFLQKDRQSFEEHMQAHQKMRQEILSKQIQAYSISGDLWFAQASATIASVFQLANTINGVLEHSVYELKRNAEVSQVTVLFVMLAVLMLLAIGLYALYQRVLKPVVVLTHIAQSIAQGNLETTLVDKPLLVKKDEVSGLAQAVEHMRQQLLEEKQRDITQTKELRKLYSAIEQSIVAVLITDNHGTIEYVNHHFQKVTGYQEVELKGKKAGVWSSGETQDQRYQELWSTILSGKVWMGELLNKRKNGEYYWALVCINPVCDEQGKITHFIDIHLDISEHKSVAEQLDFVSHYHQTTNLPNRQLLQRRFVRANQKDSQRNKLMALISLSIGRLKHINDSFGWEVGDQVLHQVGKRLKSCIGLRDMVAHQEGGKFTVLLYQVPDARTAMDLALCMVNKLSEVIDVQGHQLQLIPKAGVSVVSSGQEDFDREIKHADTALHYAEQSGDFVRLYSHEMDINSQQRLVMESALRNAIKEHALELHYQPKVDIRTGKIWAMEALARWRHEDNYISPSVFIPIAESSGLIHALGEWVLLEACLQAKSWQKQALPELVIAVNISAEQFQQADFVQTVASILTETHMTADKLELELTESIFVENTEEALIKLQALKDLGVRLAIDDFGTGYSSLSYLSWLPIDSLKIDRSFVGNITTDLRAAAIVTSVITLAQRMGLRVIAEGVETQGQLLYLAQHGCHEIQGYYFSRPLAQEAATDKLQHYLPVPLISLTQLAALEKV